MSPIRTRWRPSSRRAMSSFPNRSKIPMMACVDSNSRTLTATFCFSVVLVHERASEALQPPTLGGEQRHKLSRHKEAIFRVRNFEIALRPQHHIVIRAEVNDRPRWRLTTSQVSNLERLEFQRVRTEDADARGSCILHEIAGAFEVSGFRYRVGGARPQYRVSVSTSRNGLTFGQMKKGSARPDSNCRSLYERGRGPGTVGFG